MTTIRAFYRDLSPFNIVKYEIKGLTDKTINQEHVLHYLIAFYNLNKSKMGIVKPTLD